MLDDQVEDGVLVGFNEAVCSGASFHEWSVPHLRQRRHRKDPTNLTG